MITFPDAAGEAKVMGRISYAVAGCSERSPTEYCGPARLRLIRTGNLLRPDPSDKHTLVILKEN